MNKNKIKVTQVSRFAYPNLGGIETVINQINENLPDEEFEKAVICCSNTYKTSVNNNVKYVRSKYLFDFASNSISPQLFFRMMFLKTDIIHFHMPVIQNVVIWFLLQLLGLPKYKKMIVTYHSDIIGYDKIFKPFIPLYKYFLKKADIIHVLSHNIIESSDMIKGYKNKCIIIPYGIDIEDTQMEQKILVNGFDILNFANGKKILLCMGRFVHWKGFQVALSAMKKVDNAVLLIAGEGLEFNRFNQYIKDNNLSSKVLLLGNVVSQIEKKYLFSIIDIFIMPSIRKSESFGIVQLEAMRFSKPIINTNLGTGVNYVSVDKETGLTVEPNNVEQLRNAINELLNNDNLRILLGQNAQKRVENLFNIKHISAKYRELYLEVINE